MENAEVVAIAPQIESRLLLFGVKRSCSVTIWPGCMKLNRAFWFRQSNATLGGFLKTLCFNWIPASLRLRQMLATNAELSRKLAALEKKYDIRFKVVFDAIHDKSKVFYTRLGF